MVIQILVPRYNEGEEVIKPLLDSIAIQQSFDVKNDVGVIIVDDGSDERLNRGFLDSYPFEIKYGYGNKEGVSATRNKCLDKATADYVMFCDADDMFYNACGLYMIKNIIDKEDVDALVSLFIEEIVDPEGNHLYVNRDHDSTFVHGKIYKRSFLVENNIRWNPDLTIHEDSYFNCLARSVAENARYCNTSFYLWKWRADSVCRHDPKYMLKTYPDMLKSNTALVTELTTREKTDDANTYICQMVFDSYYCLNKDEWWADENIEYRDRVEHDFKLYYSKYKDRFNSVDDKVKNAIIVGVRNRFFQEGMMLEKITFADWIKHIEEEVN